MKEIVKYKSYMKFSGGGVTFTGGEPLLQFNFILEMVKLCKEEGITVASDTSGCVWNEKVREILEYTDIVLLDIKNYDPTVYEKVTGVALAPTLEFLEYLKKKNIKAWVRYVLVPNLTDNLESVEELAGYLKEFPNVAKIELLAFHKMGEYKWKEMGIEYRLTDTPEPTKDLLERAKNIFETTGKPVKVNL